MPLAKVNEVLQHATENHYGVAAMNVFNYETVSYTHLDVYKRQDGENP